MLRFASLGEPTTLFEAQALAEEDPYQFQWWALGLVGARAVEQKKGADKGIDGRIYFHDEAKGGKWSQSCPLADDSEYCPARESH